MSYLVWNHGTLPKGGVRKADSKCSLRKSKNRLKGAWAGKARESSPRDEML